MHLHAPRAAVFLAALAFLLAGVPARAQRASPHETVTADVDGAAISVSYGRPYMKGRVVMGGLVPFGAIWRTGADEATTLVTDRDLRFGGYRLKAGSYTIFTLPGQAAWKMIINAETGQSGLEHDASKDLATLDATPAALAAPVEQFTIAIADTPAGGTLALRWERTEVIVPFTVVK